MRNSPIFTVDPAEILDVERAVVAECVDAARGSGSLDVSVLPDAVRSQLYFLLKAVACGQRVTAVVQGRSLTTTEAAELLGMSRTLLTRLCDEALIPSFTVGSSLRVDADTVITILRERDRVKHEARQAMATADDRRRSRAAEAVGLD